MPKVDVDARTMIATPAKPSRFRRTLRLSIILLGTHALAWGVGRAQGWWATRTAEERSASIANELTHCSDLVLRFEARRSLESARAALDAHNFGIAQEKVTDAARLLKASHAPAEFTTLAEAMSKYQSSVTENLGGQQEQIGAWLAQLDGALPAQKAESAAAAP